MFARISIKKRLMFLMMTGLMAISAIMFLEARSSAKVAANEAYDRGLLGSALAISERVLIVGTEIEVDIPYVALEMLVSEHQDRIYYQVETQGQQFLTGYRDLPHPPLDRRVKGTAPVFYDAIYKGENIRVGMVQEFLSSPQLSTRVLVKVAETTDAREALINKMIREALFRQFILIVVAAAIMWWGISWGLKPLVRLQEALHRRNPNDLHPIKHDVPEEVLDLIGAINNMMERLSDSIVSMRRFTSNAAHQLRTPLAAIQTQTELALKTNDMAELHARMTHLKHSTHQSSRLINQLLSLAKASPDASQLTMTTLDVVPLCRDLAGRMVPKAMEKGIDLGFEASEETIEVSANAALLSEAINNLIDNALTYCPAETVVTLRATIQQDYVGIEVEDNGPGIAEDHIPTIFDRFDRAGRSDGEGCGLGLPIVKEIIERLGGRIEFTNRLAGGVRVCLMLPHTS
ncbi:sensor histidine kinase [Terasakiella sp. A23]|uniref:sensor histidine kinase n=1 Tax=Terasakiella sp. FCG-A23 TaxID=3080561 RepID=UPI0029535587|nr:sensor histidine kinase [Terasakiella sp. A23]MDV7340225.1 sensor histidine kinase [Terasakiella sp. A23]